MVISQSQTILRDRAKKKKAAQAVATAEGRKEGEVTQGVGGPVVRTPEQQKKFSEEAKGFQGEQRTPEREAEFRGIADPKAAANIQSAIGKIGVDTNTPQQIPVDDKGQPIQELAGDGTPLLSGSVSPVTPSDVSTVAGVGGVGKIAAGVGVMVGGKLLSKPLLSSVAKAGATSSRGLLGRVGLGLFGASGLGGVVKFSRTSVKNEAGAQVTASTKNISDIIAGVKAGLYADNPMEAVEMFNIELQNIARAEKTLQQLRNSPIDKLKFLSSGAATELAQIEGFRRMQPQIQEQLAIALAGAI